ncbi:Glycosyl hydrolases family 32 protein isoform 2 [Hibiscus syriacus]|uniref:Glycosyl hydrolases family 32 protein isoform 2 n=1 Tax=Hibiscus syriacus TaxID=106335 RepID=A0A6A2WYH7_HIBSY|nr:Glycosyl hydrolases family 32 protein isoform 2 [Hibiscus syriacus]
MAIPEIHNLRSNHVSLTNKTLKGGSVIEISNITAAHADVDVSFEIANLDKAEVLKPSRPQLLCSQKGVLVKGRLGPFGLLVLASDDLKENTAIDHSVVESFGGGGKVCITSRVYPTSAINKAAHLWDKLKP